MGKENHGFTGSTAVFLFTLGGVIGAALGALFAPTEGRQIRTKVRELAGEVKGMSDRLSTELKEKASSLRAAKKGAEGENVKSPTGVVISPGPEESEMKVTQPG